MVDPDAPSPSDPNLREYLHWYVYPIYKFSLSIPLYFVPKSISSLSFLGFSTSEYIPLFLNPDQLSYPHQSSSEKTFILRSHFDTAQIPWPLRFISLMDPHQKYIGN